MEHEKQLKPFLATVAVVRKNNLGAKLAAFAVIFLVLLVTLLLAVFVRDDAAQEAALKDAFNDFVKMERKKEW